MSEHRQMTKGPSLVSILSGWGQVALAALAVGYLFSGEVGRQEVVGAALGWALTILLTGRAIDRMAERTLARNRVRRMEESREREALRDRIERQNNTGTWEGNGPGQVLTVRWDAVSRRYLVAGWLGELWQASAETPWSDLETLAAALAEFERAGELMAWGDEGTQSIRARLDLIGRDVVSVPGWVDAPTEIRPGCQS